MNYKFVAQKKYTPFHGNTLESHLFEGFSQDEVYTEARNFMLAKTAAFKVNLQLGYKLINRITGQERDYWPSYNTEVWDKPIQIDNKRDVDAKIMSYLHAKDLTERIKYPSSAYQLKEITAIKVVIYYRNHVLGDSEIKVPDIITNNSFIVNFKETENKCMFYCITYHLIEGKKPKSNRIKRKVEKRFKQFCEFESITYTPQLFKDYQPVDSFQFDKLEDCFKVNIDMFRMDEDTLEITKIITSEKQFDTTLSILEYKGHAMYITNVDMVISKYPCNVCGIVLDTWKKLANHKRSKCEFEVLESFSKNPKKYKPFGCQVKQIIREHGFSGKLNHYFNHFIAYDFEAVQLKINEQNGENTTFDARHQAISVSICDSFTNQVKCFVNNNQKALLVEMFKYIEDKALAIKSYYELEKYFELDQVIFKKMSNAYENKNLTLATKYKNQRVNLSKCWETVPVLGFNSGRYDINLVKKDLFNVLNPNKVDMVIKNPNYMCIKTHTLKILDISNYLPAGTSYDSYLKTYLGGCKCEDKIRCVCGLGKGLFPYEYITSFDKLNETSIPQREAFDSSLKGTKISDEDYERVKFVWSHYNMKSIKDLLIWYNNLDVQPFVKAVQKQREFYKMFDMDMFLEGVSLPGLAEKVMYQIAYKDVEEQDKIVESSMDSNDVKVINSTIERLMFKLDQVNGQKKYRMVADKVRYRRDYLEIEDGSGNKLIYEFDIPKEAEYVFNKLGDVEVESENEFTASYDHSKFYSPFKFPVERFNGYKIQDEKAGRVFALSEHHVKLCLRSSGFVCCHCNQALTEKNVSCDRIDNSIGHIDGNIMMSCIECNCARKDMSIHSFRYQKMLSRNSHKLVYEIDQAEKEIYKKMKANIVGGPSIIFNRYAKRNETFLRNGSKQCKKIIGYDANALYLWALGNVMPCGRLTSIDTYDGIVDDITNDKIFGFLECDIETPEHLKDYFSEMTPIFKNIEIDPFNKDIIGDHMYEYNQSKTHQAAKSKKLIGSYFGKQILIYTPLLKWYLAHGLVITKTYSFIKASSNRVFKGFMEKVSDARRGGDVDKSQAMIAEMMKLIGNSAFGRSGMDKTKHKQVKYESDAMSVRAIVEKQNFHDVEELDGAYEVSLKKRRIKFNNPIHLSIAIYQLAKLRMLQFYYDCIDFYMDRSDFQYQETDTDSAYIAFSDENPFENLVRPELREHFKQHKYDWFPRDDTEENAKYDRRTPGLFKEEWRGDAMVSLSPKNYICYLPSGDHKQKVSAKGVQQGGNRNADILNPDSFESVVKDRITLNATNRGFRIDKVSKSVITYTQEKVGLNYYYDKRKVLSDGISTVPLDI